MLFTLGSRYLPLYRGHLASLRAKRSNLVAAYGWPIEIASSLRSSQ